MGWLDMVFRTEMIVFVFQMYHVLHQRVHMSIKSYITLRYVMIWTNKFIFDAQLCILVYEICKRGSFYQYFLTLIPWMKITCPFKMWHGITYPYKSFNGCIVGKVSSPHINDGCNCLSMLELKLIHTSKHGPSFHLGSYPAHKKLLCNYKNVEFHGYQYDCW